MSTVARYTNNGNPLSHYVKDNTGTIFYVDSRWTFDRGFETMIFKCGVRCKVPQKSWGNPVYEKRYASYKDMEKHHRELVEDLEVYLGRSASA